MGFFTEKKVEGKSNDSSSSALIIFSEGENYWKTFKPIIEELINRKIKFKYLTVDKHDPALLIDNEFIDSSYIRKTSFGYAKLSNITAEIMLSTTPNIGNSDFPIKRSEKVKKLVHIWHSCCDTGFYKIGALDSYDVALTVGNWVEKNIREVEQKRNLNRKEVVPVGLPYLDELASEAISTNSKTDPQEKKSKKILLLAPSWGEKNFFNHYGTDFIKELAQDDYQVILRPHPQSFISEPKLIETLKEVASNYKNVKFDGNVNGLNSMADADLLISDKSSIRFDYSFIFNKPVLTLDIPSTELSTYEAIYLSEIWEKEEAKKIGIVLEVKDRELIVDSIEKALSFKPSQLIEERNKSIVNFSSSSKAIVDWLEESINKSVSV